MVLQTKSVQALGGEYSISVENDIILMRLTGKITNVIVRAMSEELVKTAETVKAQGKRVVVLADVPGLRFSDITSGARTEARRLLADVPVEAWAVVGTTRLGTLAIYMARAAGAGDKLRYFANRDAARRWLQKTTSVEPQQSLVSVVAAITIALIGVLALVGWQTHNAYLRSLLPDLRPMNPVAAVGLLALAVAFISYYLSAFRLLRLAGLVGVLLGVSALLPLPIDTLLYGNEVHALGAHVQLADSAAICFILVGLLGLLAGRKERWVYPLEYVLAGVMGGIALFNIFGQLYAHDFVYGLSDSFVMALNLALAFFISSVSMIILILFRQVGDTLRRISRTGWLIVVALLFVQVATYGSWIQTIHHNKQEATQAFQAKAQDINDRVNTRLQTYVNALHGFRGLFAASSYVSQGDFEAYYQSLNLKKNYPGLRSMAFISAVKTADLPAFVAQRRTDNTLRDNRQFVVTSQTPEPLHFIVTYVADATATTTYGRDVTSIAGRSAIYNAALATNDYYGSGTLLFAANATEPATRGFLLAAPVAGADNPQKIGLVNAVFNYDDFFTALLKTTDTQGLSITVTDSTNTAAIFTSGAKTPADRQLSQKFTVSPAQHQSWTLQVKAPNNFGATDAQARLPRFILLGGQLFTALLVMIFLLQIRSRSQALELADAVTQDLQNERNNIAKLHKKDEAILAGIGEGLIAVDPSGKIEIVNKAAADMSGYSEQEMLGQRLSTVMKATDQKGAPIPEDKRPFELALAQAKTITTRLNYFRKDGQPFPVELNVAPIFLQNKLLGAIEIFHDITREKQLEHSKDEFLSIASHELRTPMGAIRANLSMILEGDYGPINKGLAEPLTDMKTSTIRLVDLVTDLLNVARIEAGRLKFSLSDFAIHEALRSVVASLAPLGKEKGVRITLASKNAGVVQADVDKIKQVLTNLIGNSLKFTDKGTITVTAQTQKNMIEIAVSDTGIGIAAEDQKRLFSKFNQITSAQEGKPDGTGLGLYISREIIRKMGGDLWIKDSAPGKGSTFTFTVPRPGSSEAKKTKQALKREAALHPDQK